jgi:hypothetical protein
MQEEIISRKLNLTNFDENSWQKKLYKVYKALQAMENHKNTEPYISNSM